MAKSKTTALPEVPPTTTRRTRSIDPHVDTPTPTVLVDRLARFVFVPDTSFACGDANEWKERGSPEWVALQKCPKLGSFLSTNPMTVVYARLTDDLTVEVTQISMGGAFLSERMARGILPFLPWYGDAAKAAQRTVSNPDEEGKTLPQKRELRAAKVDQAQAAA